MTGPTHQFSNRQPLPTKEEAEAMLEKFHEAIPAVREFHKKLQLERLILMKDAAIRKVFEIIADDGCCECDPDSEAPHTCTGGKIEAVLKPALVTTAEVSVRDMAIERVVFAAREYHRVQLPRTFAEDAFGQLTLALAALDKIMHPTPLSPQAAIEKIRALWEDRSASYEDVVRRIEAVLEEVPKS